MKKLLAGLIALAALAPFAAAQAVTPGDALERIFTAEKLQPEWFSSEVLAAVPLSQLEAIIGQIKGQLGAFENVEGGQNPYVVSFQKGTATTYVVLDSQGKISGLQFTQLAPKVASLEDALARFRDLPGSVSVLVEQNDKERASLNPDQLLAVGSTFKLAVLDALKTQIAAGARRWDQVERLDPSWKSLPSGILQGWPDGTPVTIQTLATLMISLSDNTAADALISIAGRADVEKLAPHSVPLITTRELFALKNPQNKDLLDRYLKGNTEERRAVLVEADGRSLPSADVFAGNPVAPEVEYFFSARELCSLMADVQDLALMSVTPGLANPADWAHVAYKGGSEPGVINLTTWLVAKDGTTYCVSATQNRSDAPVDQTAFFTLYTGLLEALKK